MSATTSKPRQSRRLRRTFPTVKGVGWFLIAALGLLVAIWASIYTGINQVSLHDGLDALLGTPTTDAQRIIYELRMPRTLTGVLAGLAFGTAGAVMQGLTRNPLADPGLLGINAGAALAVVVSIMIVKISSHQDHLWFAFAGAAFAAAFVYALGSLGLGGATPVKLALAGAATTAFLNAITTMLTLPEASLMDDFRFWAIGSLTRGELGSLLGVTPFIVLGLVIAGGLTPTFNALALGDDLAQSLGTRLYLTRGLAAVAVVLLAGGATAVAGPLGFIGLVIPHIARILHGSDYRWIFVSTLLLSPTLLLFADVFARMIIRPQQLQVGVMTAAIGAPFFLYLVRNRKLVSV